MKRLIAVIVFAMTVCCGANAQSFLEGLGKSAMERAKNGVKSKIEQKVDEKVDRGVDAVLGGKKGKKDEGASEAPVQQAEQQAAPAQAGPAWTCPECGKAGNTGSTCVDCGAKRPSDAPAEAAGEQAKSDFVPGAVTLFEDNVTGEQVGEFPSRWNLIK
ncbi:MAG: hypothetical protein KBT08_10155, partial [Bacteroidales bacterium]|nr:hypothetical protein [Candidatus Cryptobacteroides onthequi]